jgi:cell division protein ZapD
MQPKHKFQSVEPYGRNQTVPEQVTYEQPLNERIRIMLRLEFLFEQANTHIYRHSMWDNRAALHALFDIINIFTRADLKTDIMKELERQTQFLEKLAENPQVDKRRLESVLDEMDVLIDRLHGLKAQDMDIRGNEFLSSIKQRDHIAGGACDFDLPAYHFWLSRPEEKRVLDMQQWLEPFEPIQQSINLILRLIRDSAQTSNETAEAGFFQKSLDSSSVCQLIRVTLPGDNPCFAEISGGKHRFTIRFMETGFNDRPSQTDQDVPFKLTCCML